MIRRLALCAAVLAVLVGSAGRAHAFMIVKEGADANFADYGKLYASVTVSGEVFVNPGYPDFTVYKATVHTAPVNPPAPACYAEVDIAGSASQPMSADKFFKVAPTGAFATLHVASTPCGAVDVRWVATPGTGRREAMAEGTIGSRSIQFQSAHVDWVFLPPDQ